MATENTTKSSIKKDKKSKRKSVGAATPVPKPAVMEDELAATLSSKPTKKRKKDTTTTDVAESISEAQTGDGPAKSRKTVKTSEEVEVADGGLETPVKSKKKDKKKEEKNVIVEEEVVPVPAGKKEKKAVKAVEEEKVEETTPVKVGKGKKATNVGKALEEETVEEDAPAQAVGKEKKAGKTGKVVEIATEPQTAKSKRASKSTTKQPLPVEETVSEKQKKSKKDNAAKVVNIEEPSKKSKKTKDTLKTTTTAPAPTLSEPNPTPASLKSSKASNAPTKDEKPAKKSKKTKAKEPSPSPEPEAVFDDDDDAEVDSQEDEEEDADLHGFSTDDDDSSDEEDAMNDEAFGLDVSKLPTIAKDDATVKRKLEKAKRQPTEDRGVLFLSRLPHGFYEDQLKAYFTQFGTVTRLRLSRNKKTGRSKHYAFLEFDSSSVAQIVADTMDNYLLMGHILRCKVIPKDDVHPQLWVGANRKWRLVPRERVTRVEHNKPRTEEEQVRAAKRLIARQNVRKRKLVDAGIKYDFEAVSYKKAKDTEA